MSFSRDKASRYIFDALSSYVNDSSTYEFDLSRSYVDFTTEDKDILNKMHLVQKQEIITNANFALVKYNDTLALIIVGEAVNYMLGEDILFPLDIDLALFVFLTYTLNVKVNNSISSTEIYNNVLCQQDDENYKGHDLASLEKYFEAIAVYEIDKSSRLLTNNIYNPYAYYLLYNMKNKSKSKGRWEHDTLDSIEQVVLSENDKIPYHNIVQSLLANQWSHSFLESYRCIERLFHIVKLETFYLTLRTSVPLIEVSKSIEDKIGWRPQEEDSIEEIFEKIDSTLMLEIETIKNKYAQDMKICKWYYKLRNSIAHYRPIHEPIIMLDDEWNKLIKFNYDVILNLYDTYKSSL